MSNVISHAICGWPENKSGARPKITRLIKIKNTAPKDALGIQHTLIRNGDVNNLIGSDFSGSNKKA
jgi:hypothetical protein